MIGRVCRGRERVIFHGRFANAGRAVIRPKVGERLGGILAILEPSHQGAAKIGDRL
jgi:hypothetical protein